MRSRIYFGPGASARPPRRHRSNRAAEGIRASILQTIRSERACRDDVKETEDATFS
jgi:hypothetical protein